MGKTDKDRPYWVRSTDPFERRNLNHQHTRWIRGRGTVTVECDLKDDVDVTREDYMRFGRPNGCGYELCYRWYRTNVPCWFVDHVWYGPERRREREELSRARHLYNNGEMDDGFDFANYGHHHSACWLWW